MDIFRIRYIWIISRQPYQHIDLNIKIEYELWRIFVTFLSRRYFLTSISSKKRFLKKQSLTFSE